MLEEHSNNSSLRSRRDWVPARTSVPDASAKSRAGRAGRSRLAARENSLTGAREGISGFAATTFARAPTPVSYAG